MAFVACSETDNTPSTANERSAQMTNVHVGGDGIVLALVDTGSYASFVEEDWAQDGSLVSHLVEQMNALSLLAWGTGFETDWKVEFRQGVTDLKGFRNFGGILRSTTGKLHLVNYDSLTMAARFPDYVLPDQETQRYAIDFPVGTYRFHIVQMPDPNSDGWWEEYEDKPEFIIEWESVERGSNGFGEVPWFKL